MLKFIFLLICFLVTAFYVDSKFSRAVRIIRYKDDETNGEAMVSIIAMVFSCLLWTTYFTIF